MEQKMSRSRWAAIGAAVAVTLGGGGLIGVSAAGVADSAALVTVDPIRILDTRGGDKVSGETYLLQVSGSVTTYSGSGTSTATAVPTGASSVSMNLTVTEGVRNGGYGFVTAFPCTDASDTVPNASTINFVESVDVANGVTVPLGADGEICLNVYGSAHLIVDVSGYYTDSRLDDIEADITALDESTLGNLSMGMSISPYALRLADFNCAAAGTPCTLTEPGGGMPLLTLPNADASLAAGQGSLRLPLEAPRYISDTEYRPYAFVLCVYHPTAANSVMPAIADITMYHRDADSTTMGEIQLEPVSGDYPLVPAQNTDECFTLLPADYTWASGEAGYTVEIDFIDNRTSALENKMYLRSADVTWFNVAEEG
jgi:hypothetical protein